jgi:hypothetical protein
MKASARSRNKNGSFVVEHGLTGTSFHRRFWGMRARCTKPYSISYKNYGGRGIKCEWLTFEDFKKDMYESYLSHVKEFGELNTFLDRTNNDGDYCKSNCRWQTRKQQNRNTRKKLYLTARGETLQLCEWAEKLGVRPQLIWTRLYRDKRTVEEALFTPRVRTKHV